MMLSVLRSGRLAVIAAPVLLGAFTAHAEAPSSAALSAAIAQYAAYVGSEADGLVTATTALTDAVAGGRLADARAAYAPAHRHYERIEPVAELFGELDPNIDARADDFAQHEKDPNWRGFHRLEKAIFADHNLKDMAPVAHELQQNVATLRQRIAGLTITPKVFVGGAAELIEEVADHKISGEEDRYSRTDLWDFAANVEGAQAGWGLLHGLVAGKDPELAQRIDGNFARVDAKLATYRKGEGFVTYDRVTPADRVALKGPVTALAEDLSTLRGTLGLK